MSKYTEKIEKLPLIERHSIEMGVGVLTNEYLEKQFKELDDDPPSLDRIADHLRHGDWLEAQVAILWRIVNEKDIFGRVKVGDVDTTLLIYAAEVNAFDVALILIGRKADVNAVDSRGYSALYLTTDQHITNALRQAGAKEMCKEDLVKVDQDKVISVKMTKYERMALCDMATYALTPPTEYDHNNTAMAAWYLLDYMLENCDNFSFMTFVYVLANSRLEFASSYDACDFKNMLTDMTNSGYISINIPEDSFYQFRKLSYDDPKLSFYVDPEELMYHPVDSEDNMVKDLKPTGPACLLVLKDTLEAVDTEILTRRPWGLLSLGYLAGKF